MRDIDIRRVHGVYEVYVEGAFWCSCTSLREVEEELEEIERKEAS